MKQYHKNLTSYRKKCDQLEEEKAMLKEAKHQLEMEVVRLREELDAVSLTSSFSSINFPTSNGHLDSGFSINANNVSM